MFTLLRHRNFRLLWWGGLVSMIGDWMLRIALPVYVFELTGSTLATGLMFIAGIVPDVLLGSLAGVFVDRWDRQRTMVVVNLLQAGVLVPLLWVQSVDTLWLVYLVSIAQSLLRQFFGPAENALLPRLVGEEHLLSANALNALNNNLARLIGPALGGFVALLLSLAGVTLLDAATFLLAALLVGSIGQTGAETDGQLAQAGPTSVRGISREWIVGLRVVRHDYLVSTLFLFQILVSVGEGIMSVLFVPFVADVLHGEALHVGWLLSAQAIGGLCGGLAIGRMGTRLVPGRLLGPSAVMFGLIDLVIFNYPAYFSGVSIALILFVLVGLPGAAVAASFSTLLQRAVQDSYRGRVFGALNTISALLMLGGMVVASVMGDVVGIVPVLNIQGYGFVVAGLLALVALSMNGGRVQIPVRRP